MLPITFLIEALCHSLENPLSCIVFFIIFRLHRFNLNIHRSQESFGSRFSRFLWIKQSPPCLRWYHKLSFSMSYATISLWKRSSRNNMTMILLQICVLYTPVSQAYTQVTNDITFWHFEKVTALSTMWTNLWTDLFVCGFVLLINVAKTN